MKISRTDKDGVVVLQVSGKLMGGPDADAFDRELKLILGEGDGRSSSISETSPGSTRPASAS